MIGLDGILEKTSVSNSMFDYKYRKYYIVVRGAEFGRAKNCRGVGLVERRGACIVVDR